MTDQRELDRLLDSFFANGTDELADRVIENALDEIDHTRQRHALRLPRRIQAMPMLTRVAAAAVIGVVAVGGAFFLLKPGQPAAVGDPAPTTAATASPSAPAPTQAPTNTPEVVTPSPQAPLTGAIGEGRQIHTSTALADGRVLVAGGYGLGDVMLDSATLYDPGTGRFSPMGPLTTARGTFTTTLLADGRVLVAGGGPTAWAHADPFLASAELFDPSTGTFTSTGAMATPLEDHTATLLPNGKVLIAGGNSSNGVAVASAELYDPATGTFSPTGSMATARGYHTATLLRDGRVLIVGGAPGAWTSSDPMIVSAEMYDPKTGKFSATGQLSDARGWHAATLLADGRVLITGGQSTAGEQLASAELFDPRTGTFTPTGPMVVARQYHTATLLTDGRVLVAGGGVDYTNLNFLASAETFDPTTGVFTATGSMADARTYHGASLLPDGRVLVTGGYGALAPLASAELYDPKAGTFSPAGSGN